jgi:hypothetical protein
MEIDWDKIWDAGDVNSSDRRTTYRMLKEYHRQVLVKTPVSSDYCNCDGMKVLIDTMTVCRSKGKWVRCMLRLDQDFKPTISIISEIFQCPVCHKDLFK